MAPPARARSARRAGTPVARRCPSRAAGALHPTKLRLIEAIREEPGIHYHGLRRRLGGSPSGATRAHLQELVEEGVVWKQVAAGYACYFPHGPMDRGTMAASPVTKSEGARRVLRALMTKPWASKAELARAAGVSTAAVHKCLRKLAAADLVQMRRAGPRVQVRLTEVGLAAAAHAAARTPGRGASWGRW